MAINFTVWVLLAMAMLLMEAAGLFTVPALVWIIWWAPIVIAGLIFTVLGAAALVKLSRIR
jgi:hypothetical protein